MINTENVGSMLIAGLSQSDAYPKALANFMFRELIEDAHSKYNISQEDMKQMCKRAVDRAALYIAIMTCGREKTKQAFGVYASACAGWDDAEETEEIKNIMDTIAACEIALTSAEN